MPQLAPSNSMVVGDSPAVDLVSPPAAGGVVDSIPALRLWLKADALGLADGASISEWPDSSGNGRKMVQATGTRKPTYLAAPPGFNGKPTANFDGAADAMTTGGIGVDIARAVAALTIFAVASPDSPTVTQRLLSVSLPGGTGIRTALRISASLWEVGGRRLDADAYQSVGGGAPAIGKTNVLTGIVDYANTHLVLYEDGLQVAESLAFQTAGVTSDTDSSYLATASVSAGTGENFDGSIAELIVYAHAVTQAERQSIERYLGTKYGVVVP